MTVRTEGLSHALIAMLVEKTGKQWGDGVAPGPQNVTPAMPYGVVAVIPGGVTMGNTADPDGNAMEAVQVTGVGKTRYEAQRLAMDARSAIIDRVAGGWANAIDAYAVNAGTVTRSLAEDDGVVVWHRRFDSTGGHFREGSVSNWVDRYVLYLQPAT